MFSTLLHLGWGLSLIITDYHQPLSPHTVLRGSLCPQRQCEVGIFLTLVEPDLSKCNTFLGLGGVVPFGLSLGDSFSPCPLYFQLMLIISIKSLWKRLSCFED